MTAGRFVRIIAGDMTGDPKDIARRMYDALQAARGAQAEPRQRAVKTRDWTTEERRKLAAGEIAGEFAGPDMSFPIAGEADVEDAWNLAGHADDPDAVRAKIIGIAQKNGWTGGLPGSAQRWGKQG